MSDNAAVDCYGVSCAPDLTQIEMNCLKPQAHRREVAICNFNDRFTALKGICNQFTQIECGLLNAVGWALR